MVGDLADTLEIDDSRIGGSAADDHARLALHGQTFHLVVIDPLVLFTNVVSDDLEITPAVGERMAVCEMYAVGKVHAHDRVDWFEHRGVEGHVSQRVGGWLDGS